MKIAVASNGHIPSKYAHSINIMKHANAFFRLGHNVEILSVERYSENKFIKQISNIHDFYGISKLPLKNFKDNSIFYYYEKKLFGKLVKLLKFFFPKKIFEIQDPEKKISNYIKENSFDFCYARSYNLVKYNIINKIPTILETHNFTPEKTKDLMDVLRLSKSNYLKCIVTINKRLKDNFVKLGVDKKKILVLNDAVDLISFNNVLKKFSKSDLKKKNKINNNKKVISYIGHLYRGRGIEYILKASEKLKNYIFLIIGGTDEDVLYYKSINKSSNVIFTGHIANSLIPNYAIMSDILLMPYTKDTPTWRHMSPMKMFEYIATGNPIIATDLPVIKNILKNNKNGILIKEKNYKNLISAIKTLENKKLTNIIRRNNLKLSKNFSYEIRCKTLINEFNK